MNDTQEVFMNREQWENLARFAGVEWANMSFANMPSIHYYHNNGLRGWREWQPDSDWRDFGPLWLKLERWVATNNKTKSSYDLFDAYDNFYTAKHYGTESELMEAGCALGAAIGATMGDKA